MHRICRPHVSICRYPSRCSPIKHIFSGRDSGRGGGQKASRDTQNRTPNPTQGGRASAGQKERGHHPHPIDPSLPNRLETWCLTQRCTLEAEALPPEKLQPRGGRLLGPWLNCPPAIREKGAALTDAACAPDSSFCKARVEMRRTRAEVSLLGRCGRRRGVLGLRGRFIVTFGGQTVFPLVCF